MASTLQDLRREAGFKSAKDYAEHLGIPVPTYSRYESKPEKIPLAAAWSIADDLGCSIDAVVGREHVEVEQMRGEVQKMYDAFTPETKRLVDNFLAFSAEQDAKAEAARVQVERRRYDVVAERYLQLFCAAALADAKLKAEVVFGTPADLSGLFGQFVEESLREAREAELKSAFSAEQRDMFLRCAVRGHGQTDDEILAEFEDLRQNAEAKYVREDEEKLEKVMEAFGRNRMDEDLFSFGAQNAFPAPRTAIEYSRKEAN